MARFLGSPEGRTSGADAGGERSFSRAKVFSTPGSQSFTIPDTAKRVKVYVIGAGSCYRTTTYDFCGSGCCSGVDYPRTCYCACFTGHLTGAGGGYAEKTWTSEVAGKTMTITVGSQTGLSASTVVFNGNTVTASNATDASYSWSCTGNSTARDATNDNPIAGGFRVPVCGYRNVISGYYNLGGTASGGDVNRTGGRGTVIPEFLCDSYLDGVGNVCTSSAGGFTGNTSSCWVNPTFYCHCMGGYHYVFGSDCRSSSWSGPGCSCYTLCAGISNLCACAGTNNCDYRVSRFSFAGKGNTKASCAPLGAEASLVGTTNSAADTFIKDVPTGIGAQSGNSAANGKSGHSEMVLTHTTFSNTTYTCQIGGAGTALVEVQSCSGGYDYSFGGTGTTCFCGRYNPGCFSSCSAFTGNLSNTSWCYRCVGQIWNYVFGSGQNGCAICMCYPYGLTQVGQTQCCCCFVNRCYTLGYLNDNSLSTDENAYRLDLSGYISDTGTNSTDVTYGNGASLTPAGYGGGGNRLNPAGGSGLVVVVY